MPPDLDTDVLDQLVVDLDDRSIVENVVRTYLDALEPRLAMVEAALAAGDARAVDESAHALASASVLVGLTRLTATGRAVEHAAAAGDLVLAADRAVEMADAVSGARTALVGWLERA